MANLIRFSQFQRAISTVGAILAITCFYSSVTNHNEKIKNFALNLGVLSCGIGLTAEIVAAMAKDGILKQVEDFEEKQRSEIKSRDTKIQSLASEIASVKKNVEAMTLSNSELTNERNSQKKAIELLKGQVDSKIRSLDMKLTTEDLRYSEMVKVLKDEFWKLSRDRIDLDYSRLGESIEAKLNDPDYEPIHSQLEKFYEQLIASHEKICDKLSEIQGLESNNLPQKLADIYFEISSHTSAVKVRFRNLLNVDERLNLDAALGTIESYRNPKNFISTDKARSLLDMQQTGDLADIEKLRDSFSLNKAEFEDLKNQVADLLNEIENKNLETEKLNHRITELSEPISWKLAPNHATRAGNTIIIIAQSMNMHLDRSHYTGDVFSADLYFFTDRIKPTQTIDVKALNESGDRIAQLAHLVEPVRFLYDLDTRLVVAHVVMQHREAEKRVDPVTKVKQFLQPSESLVSFIRESFHVGLWGETGTGKTTAISNIIGGMVQELGGVPTIRLTIPKIDASTQKMFPEIHFLGISLTVWKVLKWLKPLLHLTGTGINPKY